jgi:hypothetical protein
MADRWHYMAVQIDDAKRHDEKVLGRVVHRYDAIEDVLNVYGAQGWEPFTLDAYGGNWRILLRRRDA